MTLATRTLLLCCLVIGGCDQISRECDPAPSSSAIDVGESQTIQIDFLGGGFGVVDAAGVLWVASDPPPPGVPENGTMSVEVTLLRASFPDDGPLVDGTLLVDLGEIGQVELLGPISCN